MKTVFACVFSAFVAGSVITTCVSSAAAADQAMIECAAAIPPLQFLVKQVGGDRVNVQVLVGPGQEPHTYAPEPRQILALSRATLYFKVGMPFEERMLQKITPTHSRLTICDVTHGIKPLKSSCHVHAHDHHAADHHDAEDLDPHVWLSPVNLGIMAQNIGAALKGADPANAAIYQKNQDAVIKDLDELHNLLSQLLKPFHGRSFYVYHPAFGHFAATYGLRQEAVEIEGKSPTPRQVMQLIEKARREAVRIIFVQPQFDPSRARAIADAIDGTVLSLDPLKADVLTNLREIAETLQKTFAEH